MIYRRTYFPVSRGGNIIGILHIDDIQNISESQRANFMVGYAMRKVSKFPYINERDTGKDVLKKISQMKSNPHIVVVKERDGDFILGLIGEEDLVSSLRFCQLNPDKC